MNVIETTFRVAQLSFITVEKRNRNTDRVYANRSHSSRLTRLSRERKKGIESCARAEAACGPTLAGVGNIGASIDRADETDRQMKLEER